MQGGCKMNKNYYDLIVELQKEKVFIESIRDNSQEVISDHKLNNIEINGTVCTDSERVNKGDIFVCIKGFSVDGHSFAPQAYQKGAVLLIVNDYLDLPVCQVKVTDSRKATAIIAKYVFDNPTSKLDLIGVTGTNGKTTTTFLLEQLFKIFYKKLLNNANIPVGLIGTLGYKIGDKFYPSERTTPDIIELNQIFKKMLDAGCKVVIMEVSSHALALYRVFGLNFKVGVFTNLSQDHLDFHKDMNEYGNAKLTLFEMIQHNNGYSVINIDDPFGHKIFKKISSQKAGFSISPACQMPVKDENAEYWNISEIRINSSSAMFNLYFKNLSYALRYENILSCLSGKFNIQNLVAALIVIHKYVENLFPENTGNEIYHKFSKILDYTKDLKSANGRMEKVNFTKSQQIPDIYVDYAHTPDALDNILKAAREFTKNRVICVWGCGGNRDKQKRSQMAKISINRADLTIITNDNPRLEFPADIVRDIVSELSIFSPYYIIRDRNEAIQAAINLGKPGDTIIIAGKGHETYQEIGTVKYHFDDKEEVLKALDKKYSDIITSTNTDRLKVPVDLLMLEKIFSFDIHNSFLKDNEVLFDCVSTDSRILKKQKDKSPAYNTIFFAIDGENFNGAKFVEEVLSVNDKNWCIVNKKDKEKIKTQEFDRKQRIIYVDDTITAYGKLAEKYLQLFGVKKIAITGSTGKTTTKEIMYNIFSEKFKTLKTEKNENNRIGVPKTIFTVDFSHEAIIFETGTNQFGEINALSEIIKPDLGIIINVNPSHLEFLKSEELIMQEKISMLNHVSKMGLIPSDKKFIRFLKEFSSKKIFTFNFKNRDLIYPDIHENDTLNQEDEQFNYYHNLAANFNCEILASDPDDMLVRVKVNNDIFKVNTKIPYYSLNTIVSVCAAKLFEIDNSFIQKGLMQDLKIDNRMEILHSDNSYYIYDCYNANPFSMKSAITYWSNLSEDKKHIAIIGDMLELGEKTPDFHKEIGELLQKIKEEKYGSGMFVIGIGKNSLGYKPDYHFQDVNEFIDSLTSDSNLRNRVSGINGGAVYLIKASHSIKLEKLKGIL